MIEKSNNDIMNVHWKNCVIVFEGITLAEYKEQYDMLDVPDQFVTASQLYRRADGLYDAVIYYKRKPYP